MPIPAAKIAASMVQKVHQVLGALRLRTVTLFF